MFVYMCVFICVCVCDASVTISHDERPRVDYHVDLMLQCARNSIDEMEIIVISRSIGYSILRLDFASSFATHARYTSDEEQSATATLLLCNHPFNITMNSGFAARRINIYDRVVSLSDFSLCLDC